MIGNADIWQNRQRVIVDLEGARTSTFTVLFLFINLKTSLRIRLRSNLPRNATVAIGVTNHKFLSLTS